MNNFATGFLTGFMGDQAQKISDRKSEAEDYFNKRLELAQDVVMKNRGKYEERMKGAVAKARQVMALGVPERTVMAVANQNPDDLEGLYETIQKLQVQGVDTSDPEFYDNLIQVNKEFNPDEGENITSLMKRIYMPLSENIKADPQGYEFDKKGTIWATMMGYNAREKAMARLEETPVIGGVSAAQALRDWGDETTRSPYDSVANVDASFMGNSLRQAKENLGGGDLTVAQRTSILSTFDDFMAEEMTSLTKNGELAGSPEERRKAVGSKAAMRVLRSFPEAANMTEITKWLDTGSEATPTTSSTVLPSESPVEAPTEPVESQATPTPDNPERLPERLPSGATLLKDNGDGTSQWKRPDGSVKTYRNSDVEQLTGYINRRPQTSHSTTPKSGWLDNLGSEYD